LLSVVLSGYSVDERPQPRELALVDPIEGQELLYEIVSTRSRNPRTGEQGIVSVLRNVTDLKRASDELRSSFERVQELGHEARTERQRLNLIIQSVGDPVLVTDVNNDVLLMNGEAERLFSHLEGEGIAGGRDDTRRSRYEANDARFTTFISQLRIGAAGTKTGEIELIDPDRGDPISLSVTYGEIMDERGQLNAVISILHDLTKVRELERRQLEQQLFESEKLAAVGRLAASIAHEINNPLEAIKNALYLISKKFKGDPRDQEFIEIANRETARVSRIIHEMLGFYRSSMTSGPVNVNSVLEDVLLLLEKQLRNHRVMVSRELAPELPSIMGHADQLKQVFLNIMLNNQDAMPHGGRLVARTFRGIETEPSGETRDVVNVEFTDTGEGIRPEILPHIFEPFFSTKSEKGTGLGLWVSFGIVQSHNGHISVKSQPSQGTSFTISFPAMAQV
ncbi:MAG: PAS domain-containing protein, partial [Chloroflexota bacterium]|nr:PAS domain-containing protein [Chloroflexota bacterium]